MRGSPLTKAYGPSDLSLIFWKLRTTRDTPTRRSLQRRARLALAQVESLTDSERHEVAVVWARRNVGQIDSPALRKLHTRTGGPIDGEFKPAKQFTRRATGKKKPGHARPDAANDAHFNLAQLSLVFFGT